MRCSVAQPSVVASAIVLPFPKRKAVADSATQLTAHAVNALTYSRPDRKLQFVWDTKMVGLGVRLTPAGHRAYVVRYRVNGRQRLATVGDISVHSLDDARKTARATLAKADIGIDARSERDRIVAAGTLADAWTRYTADHLVRLSPKSNVAYGLLWRVHIKKAFCEHSRRGYFAVAGRSMASRCQREARPVCRQSRI